MLKTKDLSFSYSKEVSFNFPDIECYSSQSCLLLGKSGVGKTTLLHLLAGLIRPTSGEIWIDNIKFSELRNAQQDQFRGQNIGIVFQQPHFITSITIQQNLAYTQKLAGLARDHQKIMSILESLEIGHRAHSKPNKLSQGELQRASVARAVINEPKVIFADEPTSALDDESCYQVIDLLQTTANELKAALIIVTHDARLKDIISNQILLS